MPDGMIFTQYEAAVADSAIIERSPFCSARHTLISAENPIDLAILDTDFTRDLPALILPVLTNAACYHGVIENDTGPAAEPYGAIMLVAFDVPEERTQAVADWYDHEHIELLMRADGWLRARRYTIVQQEGARHWTSLAFHELRDLNVMGSKERTIARSTSWRAELEREAWFGKAGRWVYLRR